MCSMLAAYIYDALKFYLDSQTITDLIRCLGMTSHALIHVFVLTPFIATTANPFVELKLFDKRHIVRKVGLFRLKADEISDESW